jgi:hypothetical protein
MSLASATSFSLLTAVNSKSETKLCYDRRSVGPRPDFCYCQTVAGLLIWDAVSDERTGLSFTIAAGLRQHSHSRVRVPRDSWPYFTLSDSRLPQPGRPGSRICIPQEQGGPVIPPGTGSAFRRFLLIAGLRWGYSNPPPRGELSTELRTICTAVTWQWAYVSTCLPSDCPGDSYDRFLLVPSNSWMVVIFTSWRILLKGKAIPAQAVEAHRVVGRRGSHTF